MRAQILLSVMVLSVGALPYRTYDKRSPTPQFSIIGKHGIAVSTGRPAPPTKSCNSAVESCEAPKPQIDSPYEDIVAKADPKKVLGE
jgi:hypothetical protein